MDFDFFRAKLAVALKREYTDEQVKLYEDFTTPVISFSMPGTGKTETAIAGLLCTELYHQIPGSNIVAISYTNNAVIELKNRHEEACKRLGIRQHVRFSTLSSMCSQILKENYKLLGFSDLKVTGNADYAIKAKYIMDEARDNGINVKQYKVRNILNAISVLNASLVFDRNHVESKYCFKNTGLDYEEFTFLRQSLYKLNKTMNCVQVSDISLYALEMLERNPALVKTLKEKNKVMVIDEFQDLSLLQLKLASMICNNLVAIGDIKQQIYAFNGACQEIVEQYMRYYPNARRRDLTQSFRCAEKIADYATARILPNDPDAVNFKGAVKDAELEVTDKLDFVAIVDKLQEEFIENNNTFKKSTMFLFRNNFSAIPVVEELYKRDMPMLVNSYKPAHQIPVIKEMCELVELCRNPTTPQSLGILNKFIPEFQRYKRVDENPLYKIMLQTGKSVFDIPFSYAEPDTAERSLMVILQVSKLLKMNASIKQVFNTIYPTFEANYFKPFEYIYEQEPIYYCKLIGSLTSKTYEKFIHDELDKQEKIKEWEARRFGVRCYTMHAAKGTEADTVYILDANDGIIPNNQKLEEMLKRNCVVDIAREIRNERSLVYVACTRAKTKLVVVHSGEISPLFEDGNKFSDYDEIYSRNKVCYEDVDAFLDFVKD